VTTRWPPSDVRRPRVIVLLLVVITNTSTSSTFYWIRSATIIMTLFSVPPYLDWPAQFCLLVTVVTWVLSLITSNVSQVDRLWTFLPTIYTAYYALLPLWPNTQPYPLVPYAPKDLGWAAVKDFSPRALLMFGLIFIWMCRLVLSHTSWAFV
jgi:hypothetical protein